MRLIAPDLNSRRARLADWLELEALTSPRRQASVSSIRSQVRKAGDDRMSPKDVDVDADDTGEPEILDRLSDDLEEKVFDEIAFRIATVGKSYPFELITGGRGLSHVLKLRGSWENAVTGELIYIFCLLDSGIRDGLISYPKSARPLVNAIGNVFRFAHALPSAAIPMRKWCRSAFHVATGDGFLPALQAAWARYGSFGVYETVPYGFDDRLKDGGVDIIAWSHFF